MSEVGLMPAPKGVTPDFHGTSDLQITILAVYICTSVLATVGLILRLYTGARLVRNLGLDALFLVAAWAVYLASFIAMVKVMPCGFGKPLYSVTASGMQCYKNMLLFLGISYFWPPTLAKLSLVVLYHRINPGRAYRLILYSIAAACTVYTLVFTVVLAAPCNPLREGTATCLNNIALAQAILNISTDGVLVIMPVVTIWSLQMPVKQKIAVGCILALGSGAVIASCVRIAYVRAMLNNPEVLYAQGTAAVWSAVEINVGILCNCLAMLKPFVRRHLPWLRSRIGAGGNSGRRHGGGGAAAAAAAAGGAANTTGGVGGKTAAAAFQHARGGSGGARYELYSYGRDVVVGGGFHSGTVGAKVEAGRRDSNSGSESDTLGPEGTGVPRHHGGILVTTTVAMGRSSEGDVSTEDILDRGRVEMVSPAMTNGSP